MAPRPCPTCKKTNCGNHAACARRKASECKRCGRSPCYDRTHCEHSQFMWELVGNVERVVHHVLKTKGLVPYDRIDDETLGLLRFEVFRAMDDMLREQEDRENLRLLSKIMLGGWR